MDNTSSTSSYLLPADAREHDRLAAQHLMWTHLFGGLLPSELDSEVNPLLESPTAMVLDVGCGAGHWSFDFALKYPSVNVVGFDLTNSLKLEDPPPNFEFVQGDVTKDMAQFFGRFDLLNCRAVLAHINDTVSALDFLYRCLKPGGFIVISEGDTRVFSRDMKTWAPMAVETDQDNSRSWVARFLYELEMLNWKGADLFGRDLSRRLKNNAGFADVYAKDYYSPFGWDGEDIPHGRQLSAINRVNITSLALGYRPTFLNRNHAPESAIEKWCKGVKDEVEDPTVERYVAFHVAWARREGDS